jgi:hypothetical protein
MIINYLTPAGVCRRDVAGLLHWQSLIHVAPRRLSEEDDVGGWSSHDWNNKEDGMSKLVSRAAVLLVMCAIISVPASAETITREVTFARAVTINGTLVKAGTYKAAFDDQTGELTITKGKKIVAKAPARLEKVAKDTKSVYSTRSGSDLLLSVTLKGGNLAVIENGGESGGERAQ